MYYPKHSRHEHLQRLHGQLQRLGIRELQETEEVASAVLGTLSSARTVDHVIDALFGFSFQGDVRSPFDKVIETLVVNSQRGDGVPVTAVDIPSSWDVDEGPKIGGEDGAVFLPDTLVSLTAPKPAARHFGGLARAQADKKRHRHFVGGRFISKDFASKWGFDVPEYEGTEQVVEVSIDQELAAGVETEHVKANV